MEDQGMHLDGIELLKHDHRTVEELYERYRTALDDDRRQEIVHEIVKELSVHAAVEEMIFYPTVREHAGDASGLVDHSLDEHQEVKEMLAEIDGLHIGEPTLDDLLARLMQNVSEHVDEEENVMFPKVRQALSTEAIDELGRSMAKAKKAAPTRPHPGAPNTPPANVVTGPAAAAVDKVRDAIRRKMES